MMQLSADQERRAMELSTHATHECEGYEAVDAMARELIHLRDEVAKRQWQPIETAPDDKLVVVRWLEADDKDNPERVEFDYKEDGVWAKHNDSYEHYCAVAKGENSVGPREEAPYTQWFALPETPV